MMVKTMRICPSDTAIDERGADLFRNGKGRQRRSPSALLMGNEFCGWRWCGGHWLMRKRHHRRGGLPSFSSASPSLDIEERCYWRVKYSSTRSIIGLLLLWLWENTRIVVYVLRCHPRGCWRGDHCCERLWLRVGRRDSAAVAWRRATPCGGHHEGVVFICYWGKNAGGGHCMGNLYL